MTAAIILFTWFTFLDVLVLSLTTYSFIKDPKTEVSNTFLVATLFILPVIIAGCAQVIW